MTGLEDAALKAGNIVVRGAVRAWLAQRSAENRRGAELTELIGLRFGGLSARSRRDLVRKLEEAGDTAGAHLQAWCERECADLDEAERAAAVDAAVDALSDADLSDATLLRVDLDPVSLAREVRRQVPSAPRRAGLGESARALFDRVLDRGCVQLVHLVRELPEYEERLAEEALRRLGTVLTGLDRVLDRLPATSLDAPAGADRDEEFRHRYLAAMARKHDDLELIGVSVRNFRPRTTLSVAYLSLSVDTAFQQDADFELNERHHLGGSQRIEAALGRADRVLVRGQAGSGKSTLLSWLVVTAAQERFGPALEAWNGCVPVLIKLRSHAGRPLPAPAEFVDLPTLPPVPDGWMHRQLDAGRVLLLVDGVDEVPPGQRRKVRAWLDELLRGYPGIRVVVTARPSAAGAKWLAHEGFSAVTLEDMTPGDVREFLRRWHEALLAADRDARSFERPVLEAHHRRLLAQLESRPHLRNLTRNPLLCAMVCALNLDRDGDLPRNRKGLYEAALEMLLDRRDALREITSAVSLPYPDKLVLLQDLAHWLALNNRSELTREEALTRFARTLGRSTRASTSAEDALDHLLERSGVLREPAVGRIDFVHRTFQEFLTARESVDDGNVGLLIDKASSDQWREVVIMAAGLFHRRERSELLSGILDLADRVDGRIARRLRLLAATCRESVHDLEPEVLARLDDCIGTLVPPANTTVSRSLSTVGESLLDRLPTDLSGLTEAQAAACVYTASLINGPDSLPLLQKYAADPRLAVQDELIDAWEFYDPEEYACTVLRDAPLHDGAVLIQEPDLLPWLHELRHCRHTHIQFFAPNQFDMGLLNDVRGLRSLDVLGVDAIDLTALGRHHGLRALRLMPRKPLDDIGPLSELSRLKILNIGPIAWNARWEPLDSLTEVRELTTRGLHASEHLINSLPRPEGVTRLDVRVRLREDVDLATVTERCSGLRYLGILRASLRTGNWAAVPHLRELRLFDLNDSAELSELAALTSLQKLALESCEAVDLSSLRNPDLAVLVHEDASVSGADDLPPGTRVRRIKSREKSIARVKKMNRYYAYRY
ncbi:NACHT domain-containing protein [Saccharopolyspora sp. NPDC047091]|uniref:NACHT domain-containing protein n=1 Tax=Saccharopolyspora sp. NPDC047091 TaxID=3155924 RepID=UPI003404D0A4